MKRMYIFLSKKSLTVCLTAISVTLLLTIPFIWNVYIDKDYMSALRTADRYLYAWIMRDGSIAYDLISDNIRKNYKDLTDFQIHFAGLSNPHHEAFEIIGYKRMSNDRICFKVWCYEDYTGVDQPP